METTKKQLIVAGLIAAVAIGAAVTAAVSSSKSEEIKPVSIPAGPNARTEDEPEIFGNQQVTPQTPHQLQNENK